MRAGLSSEILASGCAVGARVSVVRGGRPVAAGVPVSGVMVEATADRDVPVQVTVKAPAAWTPTHPTDPLAAFGQRLLISAVVVPSDGVERTVLVGEYLIKGWGSGESEVTVTAVDLMQVPADDPMPWPSSPPAGATLRSELQRLASGLTVVLDQGVVDSAVSRTAQWGTSRVEALQTLAASRSVGLRVGADGQLHAHPLGSGSNPSIIFEAASLPGRAGNGLLVSVDPVPRSERRANRWIVTGTQSSGSDDEVRWTATRTATDPPYDPGSYGWVTSHKEFSAASSQAAVEAAADTYMREDVSAATALTLQVVPDPRIELGDVVGVVAADGTTWAGRVTAYSLPLSDVASSMRVDIDILEW